MATIARISIPSAKGYFIQWDDPQMNEIVISTPKGDVILEVGRIATLSLAVELAAVETQRMKRELKQIAEEMREAYPLNVLDSILAFPGRGGCKNEPRINL